MPHEIDWFQHYNSKLASLDFKKTDLNKFKRQNKALLRKIISFKPRRIIEVGCGLARDSFVLASKGFDVTVLDRDPRILQLAKKNSKNLGLHLKIIKGIFFHLQKTVKSSYDVVFHSGALEHFDDKDVVKILRNQLEVAPVIVFSVPLKSRFNEKYFRGKEKVFRRLLSKKAWLKILSGFCVARARLVHDRHDDLLLVLIRERH
jgi:2-polyprenyl-3-methyl-5-hydroxy-6-metoxy-1,4-benzoquinol methylase